MTQPARLALVGVRRGSGRGHADHRLLAAGPLACSRVGPVSPLHAIAPESLAAHRQRLGDRPDVAGPGGDVLLETLEDIDLDGRGGGHFPVARKWRLALRHGGGGSIIANGAESEPASAKDAALLQTRPHLVLDGLACAAEAVGARHCVLALHEAARASMRAVTRALAERAAAQLPDPPVRVVVLADRYLSGESSALLSAVAGGPSLPTYRRRPAAAEGLGGLPTVVHNVETLARIGLAARLGARPDVAGCLGTVVLPETRTVVEFGPDASIGSLIGAAGWRGEPPAAVLLGGYGGSWLPWSAAEGLVPLRDRAARQLLGAGVVVPVGSDACGVAETARLLAFLAAESAGQCGPCVFGLPALARTWALLAAGRARPADLRRLDRQSDEVDGRGGCHHPDGAARLSRSARRTFASDVADHLDGYPCPHAARGSVLPMPMPARAAR